MPKSSRSSNPILKPWKALRRWLKRIDRQLATRQGGPWKRATEYALVFSLPVAILLAILVDELGVTVSTTPVKKWKTQTWNFQRSMNRLNHSRHWRKG